MEGPLTPEQQLQILGHIWGPPDADGETYVFLPYIEGTARTKEARKKAYHEGRAFAWPRQRADILNHIKQHDQLGNELYFTPNRFMAKYRKAEVTAEERVLYADLDEADPRSVDDTMKPTIAWETSPGRYQAVWVMDDVKVGASLPAQENHRLSIMLGADPSGWDATQLLRIPGRVNRKPDHGQDGVPGRLLWSSGPRYTWSDWEGLPEIALADGEASAFIDDQLLDDVDAKAAWNKVRLRVSTRVREYMRMRDAGGLDRSETLWQIERELADHGCSLLEIIAIVRASVWNKYAGRNDELKRLKIEAAKALAEVDHASDDTLEGGVGIEDLPDGPIWLNDLVQDPIPRPRWLVSDVWTEAGCGFVSGAPKSYKSWLALDLAFSVATGTPWLGHPVIGGPAPVLYLQEEDSLALVMSRLELITDAKAPERHWFGRLTVDDGGRSPLEALRSPPGASDGAGVGLDRAGGETAAKGPSGAAEVTWHPPTRRIPMAMHVQTGFTGSDPGWQGWLGGMVEEHGFRLVVIDTLGTTAGDIDTDRAQELMIKLLRPLRQIAHEHKVAIMIVHHNKKDTGGGGRSGSMMLGSVALHAWVDCALYAGVVEGQPGRVVLHREAKAAMDWRKTIMIPRMGAMRSADGEEAWVGWQPEIVMTDAQVVDHAPKVNGDGEVNGAKPKLGIAAYKLKNMGPNPTREKAERMFSGNDLAAFRRALKSGAITEGEGGVISW